ncbi:MAG: hypothetical protein AVDCRST_MAG67-3635 [uncultured Solirubrobacteraceae bacterium]|uniref:Uncharacterized protein n=1 Tax=uncultured Solirubrobacteraceae bacterium TaxID=1162706 RepID=A0A6J4TL92_9ACTN|nr:MAG: hypothetical protein AVDCRST_MAG67-3635 [uncultured Solirubrobacteraceae bacterium]
MQIRARGRDPCRAVVSEGRWIVSREVRMLPGEATRPAARRLRS